jgi:hypothetical protein
MLNILISFMLTLLGISAPAALCAAGLLSSSPTLWQAVPPACLPSATEQHACLAMITLFHCIMTVCSHAVSHAAGLLSSSPTWWLDSLRACLPSATRSSLPTCHSLVAHTPTSLLCLGSSWRGSLWQT